MITDNLQIEKENVRKLLLCGSGDAALLYLYVHSGNPQENAEAELKLTPARKACAAATLRQMGLWPEERRVIIQPGERPQYSEKDVVDAMDRDGEFRMLYHEIQRLLGRAMNTEELKILLGFQRYLGLPGEVVSVLVSYCRERARQMGKLKSPSLRTIEKEAYAWAEQGIDSMEEAAAYIHSQNQRHSRLAHLQGILQLRGRALTPAEERYAKEWLEMGFDDSAIQLAYEKTCLNTGGLNWAYMNKILIRWHEGGMHTAEQVKAGDHKSGSKAVPKGASGKFGAAELEVLQRMMREG